MQSAKSSHKKQIFTTYLCRPAFFMLIRKLIFFVQLGKKFFPVREKYFPNWEKYGT